MWKIEVWVRRTGWRHVGSVDTFEQALEATVTIAEQQGVARAYKPEAPEHEVRGIRAYRERGFCYWTGSGGHEDERR